MRYRFSLPAGSPEDVSLLLERAAEHCQVSVPPQISTGYRNWIDGVRVLYEGSPMHGGFGHNTIDQLNSLVDCQARAMRGEPHVKSDEEVVYQASAVLKVFRDYFVYAMSLMPVGTSTYWKPSTIPALELVVTDGREPKGYIKLI